jgi:hypothetical protein
MPTSAYIPCLWWREINDLIWFKHNLCWWLYSQKIVAKSVKWNNWTFMESMEHGSNNPQITTFWTRRLMLLVVDAKPHYIVIYYNTIIYRVTNLSCFYTLYIVYIFDIIALYKVYMKKVICLRKISREITKHFNPTHGTHYSV